MSIIMRSGISLFFIAWFVAAQPASAKQARCFTSDDGEYECEFKITDNKGSFEVSAAGKPTMILVIDPPGVAYGWANFGTGRNVFLPGKYLRDDADKACWVNDETNTKICVW
ncbi:hypothetical protein [Pseudovibrio sp. Alg231-02]|uniref:hypothetical protein n=1 Tax=Pseudovibrio sp. Alg231-02 TaxID=1922223 RepID=UPI000D54FF86|nr:hypothetical protein [Pseudovibrio sp. Alg231-02]